MKFGGLAFLAAAAAIACTPGTVFAADLMEPPTAPMMVPSMAPAFNWTGGYIGGQIGYGWSNTAVGPVSVFELATDPAPAGVQPPFSFSGSGLIGGLETGYNWQASNLVLGVVADISASGIRGTYTNTTGLNYTVQSDIKWLSTARLNIGLPMNDFLLYATGGLAVGGLEATLNDVYGPTTITRTSAATGIGWTIGAGAAMAINSHWVAKAEYLYVDLGSSDYSFSEPNPPGFERITNSSKTTANIVKFAIDYKF